VLIGVAVGTQSGTFKRTPPKTPRLGIRLFRHSSSHKSALAPVRRACKRTGVRGTADKCLMPMPMLPQRVRPLSSRPTL
jgi:hypothetical protein